ncbi:MAG: biotin--[acetyl-CoA-carboxylase] ligase, partial [Lachnospiraceae bacterium]|nr:biotin--[acetyl-CoA-carboxylase] ligase [Lachnospiraceae bacterium]
LAAALAVRRAIRQLSGKELLLKWPNDLYADGRKCCGILSELIRLSAGDWAIVTGIGINLTPQAYGPALAGTAVSLEEAGIAAGRCALIAAIRRSFCEMIGTIVSQGGTLGSLQQEYTENLLWLGREVSLRDAAGQGPEGVLRGISPRGELLLETAEGLQSFLAGELSLRPRTEEKVFDP